MSWIEKISQTVSEAVTGFLGPIANFLEGYVWDWPPQAPLLAIVLLGTGLFVTLRLGFVQVRGFRHAVAIASGRYDDPEDEGDLKHYQALTTALSATVGIGNIAGVAIAIRLGGPGALFWMWVTAFFGMALKYVECTLALRYRSVHEDGSVSGGPMYYIELGLGKSWKWMAVAFASFAVICSFGSGNMNQSNTMADAMHAHFGIHPIWTALVGAILVGMVIIGGIRRIGKVTAVLAPSMALLYVGGALVVMAMNISQLPQIFGLIISQAFAPTSLVGGAAGSFLMTLMWGVRRGLFSNEAGQGSAPIAHATAKTTEPVREGLVASLGPFIDTLVICSMTGFVILVSGAYKDKLDQRMGLGEVTAVVGQAPTDADLGRLWSEREAQGEGLGTFDVLDGRPQGGGFVTLNAVIEEPRILDTDGRPWSGSLSVASDGSLAVVGSGGAALDSLALEGKALLTGAPMTAHGFSKALPGTGGDLIVTLAVLLFAISTAISWSYYGDRATEYLVGPRWVPVYRWVYVGFFFLGAILPLSAVWTFGDVALGLMSFPNLLALIMLSGATAAMSREYFSREHKPFK
ncbi:MAG: sodium:alanine symporter family protein [Acidobacteriota bacterium]|nr:sodium:alanine symporter family protein [Acidobacteriota bacterium]